MLEKLKKGFSIFIKKTLSVEKIDEAIKDLRILLISNDVAIDTADAICDNIIESFKGQQISRLTSIKKTVFYTLKETIINILTPKKEIDIIKEIKLKNSQNLPYVIVFLGINGTGKTTTIAKVANFLKKNNISSVAAASDTFRAGAIEQLTQHMNNVGIKIIKHRYNSDPASVAYDAIEHARAKNINVVLIDTSGRQTTNHNLMKEMQKIVRVTKPDLTVFIGDSLAGNDILSQAKAFDKEVGIDANILTKLDADSKGGAALSIAYETRKPLLWIGTGQEYDDLEPFNKDWFLLNILEIE